MSQKLLNTDLYVLESIESSIGKIMVEVQRFGAELRRLRREYPETVTSIDSLLRDRTTIVAAPNEARE